MNQTLLHDTSQYSPGGLVVSVTDSGGGGTGFDSPPHHFFFLRYQIISEIQKLCISFLLCSLKKNNNNKYQILNKPVVILKF